MLELLLVLPIASLLLLGLVVSLKTSVYSYLRATARAELQHEVQMSFERVTEDCLSAVRMGPSGMPESIELKDEAGKCTVYYVHEDRQHLRKLVRLNKDYPMTGDHAWAKVEVTSFGCEAVDAVARPGLYRIWLTAECRRWCEQPYGLVTEVYAHPCKEGNANGKG